MRILITGNMGYVGPVVAKRLRETHRDAEIYGFDTAYFGDLLTGVYFPDRFLDRQIFGDLREIRRKELQGIDAVVHLASLSNDPMGNKYEPQTMDINVRAGERLAALAREEGVRSFVFASSCSVYGTAEDAAPKNESSATNPLTAYARSKVEMEKMLSSLSAPGFLTTSLRFATACGASPRLRLDLVLNDFVANAMASKKIRILSDGTPWRPLINVEDMARAIDWAIRRDAGAGGTNLVVNAGRDDWNFQIADLAHAVARVLGDVEVEINKHSEPDKRSYRVDFSLFAKLAGSFAPRCTLEKTIDDLRSVLGNFDYGGADFRNSRYMRLRALDYHKERGNLTPDLFWV